MANGVGAIGNLLGKVNANGALLVTLDGGTATATVFYAGDGSASAPSYSFSSQTNLGWYRAGTNAMAGSFGGAVSNYISDTDFRLASVLSLGWTNTGNAATGSVDLSLFRDAANTLALKNSNSPQFLRGYSANGGYIQSISSLTELTTIAAAATTDTTIQMPANSVVLGVSVRVVTVIPTAATFTVGDSGSAARFSTAAVSTAATSTDAGTKAGAYYNASALSVRITPNASPATATGQVRVTIFYYSITPPTS